MTTRIDDLKVGRWFAIKAERDIEEQPTFAEMPYLRSRNLRTTAVTGQPLKIVAISLPFIVVTDGVGRFTLDTRLYDFIRLSAKYVRALTEVVVESDGQRLVAYLDQIKKLPKENPDPKLCPNCSEGRLRQTYRKEVWIFLCPVCGFEGRPPIENISG